MKVLYENKREDKDEWINLWNQFPNKEIYAHPEYLKLEVGEGSNACCAVYQEDGEIVFYPFILRDITYLDIFKNLSDKLFDTITPYGYGGYYYNGNMDNKKDTLKIFWNEYSKWAKKNKVVCEFIRFNLNNDNLAYYPGQICHNNNNIIVDLTKNIDFIYKEFKHKVRKNVNRAISNGLQIIVDYDGERLDDFLKIYYETMNRRNANDHYFFPKEYFLQLNEKLKGQYIYMYVLFDGSVISTELLLLSDFNIYSFLGGTNEKFFPLRPNDFLKFKIIEWGIQNGKKSFVLGGGYIYNDGIFEYKHAFSPNGVTPFYIGKQIFNESSYQGLVKIKKDNDPLFDANNPFFPLYRN